MNKKIIYDFLKSKFSNEYAIFGIMGNLKAESNLIPTNVENSSGYSDERYIKEILPNKELFTLDRHGYGLAQWTHPKRKELLYVYCEGDINKLCDTLNQIKFLYWEMTYYYPKVLEQLKICTSMREATKIVLKQYEQPYDQSEDNIDRRTEIAENLYNELASKREYLIHEVKQGDTLRSIANLYKVGVSTIRDYNDIDNMVYPHTIVKIPISNKETEHKYIMHTVQRGDTLWSLAKKYYGSGTKYTKIVQDNKLEGDIICVGQQIKIVI